MPGNLYRKSETIEFADGRVTVTEISAGALLKAELDGKSVDIFYLMEHCTDADIDAIGQSAYREIVEVLRRLNAPLFEESGSEAKQVKKK